VSSATETDRDEAVEGLKRKIEEYERWFRALDAQMRVLERERQKLSAVLNHTDAAFVLMDASLRIVWANHVFVRLFGNRPHQAAMTGLPCHEALCGGDAICDSCPALQPFRTGAVAHHEIRSEVNGEPRHLYATAMPILSPEGRIDETMVMLQDVSDLAVLRRSQEALKASEERFRSIFENAGAGMATVTPDGRFLQVNRALCEFLGYDEAALTSMKVLDVTHELDALVTESRMEETKEPGAPRLVLEKRYVRKDGRTVWGRVAASWVFDADSRPVYAIAMVEDITQRREAEEALRESEARKGAILDTALDCIITTDSAGKIIEFNPAAQSAFGLSRDEALGRDIINLMSFAPPSAASEGSGTGPLSLDETSRSGRRMSLSARRADGTEFPAELAIGRIPLPGSPVFTCYVRDLTERLQAEEALRRSEEQLRQSQKMEAIGTLAGGVAHDFNNILTGVLGYAEMLKREAAPGDRVHQAADIIHKAARRGADLTQQLLGFARKGKQQNVPVDIRAAIHEIVELLSRTIDKNITITQRFRDAGAQVVGDPSQLEQVILNLAVNARDAMPKGGELTFVTDTITLAEADCRRHAGAKPGKYLMVSVIDTGCGVPEELREKIFEPFFTTKERGKGTGMGLAMVYGIVRNHGGSLRMESEVRRGTNISIYLPLASAADTAGETRPGGDLVRGSGLILVVDDEEAVRGVAGEYLKHLGYDVITAADGREAIEIYKERGREISLVVMDLVMPRLGGRECFRVLRQIDPRVKTILSTGYGFNVLAQEMLDEGMLGFVQKPYDMNRLSEVVAKALAS
jgi:PAS domain S-box-containing protein